MKKVLVSLLVILFGAWAGATLYVGGQTQPALQAFLDAGNEQTESMGVRQEIVSFKRGFVRSRAVTKMNVTAPPFDELIGDVQFVNDITNGPLLFGGDSPVQLGLSRITTRLDMDALDKDRREWLQKAFKGQQVLESRTFLNFGGIVGYSVRINPMKLDLEGMRFTMEGAEIEGSTDADMRGSYRMQAGKIEVQADGSFITLPSLESSGTITGIIAGQALGTFSATLAQVSVRSKASPEAVRFDAAFETSSDIADNGAEGSFELAVDNIRGAGDIVNGLRLSAGFEGLNPAGLEALNSLQKDMARLQRQGAFDEQAMQTPEGRQKMQELLSGVPDRFITAIFRDLLQTGKSRMRQRLTAHSPGGKAALDIDLTYIGTQTPGMQELAAYGPDDWAGMMKGSLALDIDRSMPPQLFIMMLIPYAEQGILVDEGDRLKARIELEGENIVLNGKRMRFSELLSTLAPQAAQDTSAGTAGTGPELPDDIMLKMQQEGLTPEFMQMLEERDDVSPESLEMFRQLYRMQQEMQAGTMPRQL